MLKFSCIYLNILPGHEEKYYHQPDMGAIRRIREGERPLQKKLTAWAIAVLAAVAVLRLKVPSVWLVVGGGLLGYLFHFMVGVP